MKGRLTKAQRKAIRLAQRGPLVRCRHGFHGVTKYGEVSTATVKSLLARGRLAVATATTSGDPIEVCHVGTQAEFDFSQPA